MESWTEGKVIQHRKQRPLIGKVAKRAELFNLGCPLLRSEGGSGSGSLIGFAQPQKGFQAEGGFE